MRARLFSFDAAFHYYCHAAYCLPFDIISPFFAAIDDVAMLMIDV